MFHSVIVRMNSTSMTQQTLKEQGVCHAE